MKNKYLKALSIFLSLSLIIGALTPVSNSLAEDTEESEDVIYDYNIVDKREALYEGMYLNAEEVLKYTGNINNYIYVNYYDPDVSGSTDLGNLLSEQTFEKHPQNLSYEDIITVSSYEDVTESIKKPIYSDKTFRGWLVKELKYSSVETPTYLETINLVAVTSYNYPITYELNGGTNSPDNPETYAEWVGVDSFEDATKEGYNFCGWYIDENFKNPISYIPSYATGKYTLYAKFEEIIPEETSTPESTETPVETATPGPVYDPVTYDINNYDTPLKEGDYLNPTDILNYVGYSYGYYFHIKYYDVVNPEEGDDPQLILDSSYYTSTDDSKNLLSILSYYDAYGVALDNSEESFRGWKIMDVSYSAYPIISCLKLLAVTQYDYDITYELDGGTNAAENPATYTENVGVETLADATKDGYVFAGWYTDSKYKNPITGISADTTGDITLYAKFIDASEATEAPEVTVEPTSTPEATPSAESRTYPFASDSSVSLYEGMYLNAGDVLDFNGLLNPQLKLKYYDANATDSDDPICTKSYTVEDDSSKNQAVIYSYNAANGSALNDSGETFRGWKITGLHFTNSEFQYYINTVDLVAVSSYTYDIVYELAGGTNDSSNPSTYSESEGVASFADATKENYIFDGWYGDQLYTKKVTSIEPYTNGKITLFAKFISEDATEAPIEETVAPEETPFETTPAETTPAETPTGTPSDTTPSETKPAESTATVAPVNTIAPQGTTATVTPAAIATASAIPYVIETKISEKDSSGANFGKLKLKSPSQTSNSITIKWNKIKNADGYLIYGSRCDDGTVTYKKKLLKTIKKKKKVKWTHNNLLSGTYYKYQVVAYKNTKSLKKGVGNKKNKKETLVTSTDIHITTSNGNYVNPKSVSVSSIGSFNLTFMDPKEVTLKKGESYQITATMDTEGKSIQMHRPISYESNKPKKAKVSSDGIIKAKKKGNCTLFVYAQNGVFDKITITIE
ncbi:MAG: InlB B-repeat-containing protein [Lachnospiraceae bacterium]|nr:InlB B-repeat-containing protein [Lachnospiraceae bacterium]